MKTGLFLGHQFYQNLHDLIGPEATKTIAKKWGGYHIYFPKPPDPIAKQKEGLS